MNKEEIERKIADAGDLHWYHRFEVIKGSGVYTPGQLSVDYHGRLKWLELEPDFFKGKRVVDVGAFSGAFSFFLEECGAEVVAVDVFDPKYNGFNLVHECRGSKVRHIIASVYDLNPVDFGYFDIVAFYGVYYHLKHPLLAFERLNSVCKEDGLLIGGGTCCDRWFHDDHPSCLNGVDLSRIKKRDIRDKKVLNVECLNDLPLTGFAPGQQFRDSSNWFIPNVECIKSWIDCSGFEVKKVSHYAAPIAREWNKKGILRSTMRFKAVKKGLPAEEYTSERMHQYTIPTAFELRRAEKKIKELEERLKKHENGI